MPSGELSRIKKPVSLSSITYGTAPTGVARTGVPHAMACRRARRSEALPCTRGARAVSVSQDTREFPVRPAMFQGAIDILGTLALILILFAGGAELRLQQAARYAPAALLLMIVSYGLSLGLIALMGRALLHLQWSASSVATRTGISSIGARNSAAVVFASCDTILT